MTYIPKVSIIVPVYNVENYLRTCLDSIMAQTFTDFEAILVDDGSTDNSGIICDEYEAKDSRFVIVHKQNEGVSKARITAFEHSKGELITFIDADDYIDKQYVSHLYECIKDNNTDASCCQYFRVNPNGPKLSVRKNYGYFDKKGIEDVIIPGLGWDIKLGKESFTQVIWSKMIKRDFVGQILDAGKGLWYGEDQCGVIRMLYIINSIYISENPLYYYVFREGQVTATMNRKRWDAYETYWERMMSEDKKGLWTLRLPYRQFEHLKRYLKSWLQNASSYSEFRNEALYALKSSILDKYLFHAKIEGLTKKERLNLFLLKNKCTFFYYYIRKVRIFIK